MRAMERKVGNLATPVTRLIADHLTIAVRGDC